MSENVLEEILRSGFAELGLQADDAAIAGFRTYYELLTERNSVMNLTAVKGEAETARLHFLDCAAVLPLLPDGRIRVIDVGSGAGFPGLPLKILRPDLELTMLDSLQKRIGFLQEVCDALALAGTACVHARAEECGALRESFDAATARAVAGLNVLCELCLPYVKPGGIFLALKGPAAEAELAEAENAIRKLGGKTEAIRDYAVPGTDLQHKAVVIRKVAPTPKQYPRRFAQIKKQPL